MGDRSTDTEVPTTDESGNAPAMRHVGQSANPRMQLIRRWGGKATWTLVDQGLVSLGSLFLTIMLSRVLSVREFGGFVTGFAIVLVAAGLHEALLLEPMLVLGPLHHQQDLRSYLKTQAVNHLVWTLPVSAVFALAGSIVMLLRWGDVIGQALWGVALSLPCILYLWMARRASYVLGRPRSALLVSLLYTTGLVLALLVGDPARWNSFLALAIVGLVAAAASVPFMLVLLSEGSVQSGSLRWINEENWRYGRWGLSGALLMTASVQAQVLVIGPFLGLAPVGVFRAMQVFVMPVNQVLTALNLLILPAMASKVGSGQLSTVRRTVWVLFAGCIGLALLYEMVLVFGAQELEQAAYGGKFEQFSYLIPILGAGPVLSAVAFAFLVCLRALELPKVNLISAAVVGPLSIVTALIFTKQFGLTGAAASYVATSAISAVTAAVLYVWMARPRLELH